jgi:hypothetical protein
MDLARNIAAFTNMFGAQNADVLFPFALINWETEDERNQFLNELADINGGKLIGEYND